MQSRGRMPPPPPPHMRHPLPHPDAFNPGLRQPPPGAFPPFDMPPHPEILEQKLSAQHNEMQKLLTENQRLARTHGTLRQELAAAQHELQTLHTQIGTIKAEREHQIRARLDGIARMEGELRGVEKVKNELDKARAEAQGLVVARQEIINKAQKMSQDLQRAHGEAHILPGLMAELEGVRQEYHHCRQTYDYEKKLYSDHYESLQAMEKNYFNMAKEVEKLQAELKNAASAERRTGGAYGGTGYNEKDINGQYPAGQKPNEDNHGVLQGSVSTAVASAGGMTAQASAQSGPMPQKAAYETPRGPIFDPQTGHYYDPQRAYGYGAPPPPGPAFDPQRAAVAGGYVHGYEAAQWAAAAAAVNPQGQVAPPPNPAYPTAAMAPNRGGSNPVHR